MPGGRVNGQGSAGRRWVNRAVRARAAAGRDPGPDPLHHIGLATFPELRYELHVSGFRLIEMGHTHVKPISYLYTIFAPWMWLYTRIAFRKEKGGVQRERNREILAALRD